MILVGKRFVVKFTKNHLSSRSPLSLWEKIICHTRFQSYHKLKSTFPSIDYVYHRYTIFDIGGNKFRLITEIDYPAQVINVKSVFTHAEYSMKKNEELMRKGKL
jgi:mRNA interferase HigB